LSRFANTSQVIVWLCRSAREVLLGRCRSMRIQRTAEGTHVLERPHPD